MVIISENVNTTSQVIMLPVNGNRYISWSYNKYKEGVISSVVKSKGSDYIVLCYENLDSPVEQKQGGRTPRTPRTPRNDLYLMSNQ